MKKTDHNTGYILLKVYTDDEWAHDDFIIFRSTKEWEDEMRQRLEAIQPLRCDKTFFKVCYHSEQECCMFKPDQPRFPEEIAMGKIDNCFVELDADEEIYFLANPNTFQILLVIIEKTEVASFTGWAALRNEDFLSAEFKVAGLFAKPE